MSTHRRRPRGRLRRGSALILVLLMTLAVAALAVAAIFMTSSAGLVARFYDKERVAAYAAESGLQMALATMRSSSNFVISDADTLSALLKGVPVLDADGRAIPGASVWVYAMRTGDVSAAGEKTITLIARAYDSFGTRQVRRMDVRQESITKYALFFNAFPSSGSVFGPTVLSGRVHSNGNLVNDAKTQFLDSVTVVGTNSGGVFTTGLRTGAESVPFPLNDQLTGLATQAAGDNLSITPITSGRPGRLEFVTLRLATGDTMAFVRYFELASGQPSDLLRVKPSGVASHSLTDRIVQNQCGAFYYRNNEWQFFPVATHRTAWAQTIINGTGYPTPGSGWDYRGNNANSLNGAAAAILSLPTSRCFPAGSPYLMPTERFTNTSRSISPNANQNTLPWGMASGWPTTDPTFIRVLRGGTDTTFTRRPRTCTFVTTVNQAGTCTTNTQADLGSWLDRPSGYTAVSGATQPPDTMRLALWPIDARRNTAFEGVVNVSRGVNDTTFVSGVVRGNVTLRVAGTVGLIDHLVYESDPNDPTKSPCTDMLGLIATKDIVIVDGAMTSVRRYAGAGGASITAHLGAGPFFLLHGYLLSTGGSVGVEGYRSTDQMVAGVAGTVPCVAPPDAKGTPLRATGGCFVHVGSAAMATFRQYIEEGKSAATATAGFHPFPIADRCQSTGRQPPGFPAVSGFTVIRTLEVDASRANTEPKILALLRSLRGTNLD